MISEVEEGPGGWGRGIDTRILVLNPSPLHSTAFLHEREASFKVKTESSPHTLTINVCTLGPHVSHMCMDSLVKILSSGQRRRRKKKKKRKISVVNAISQVRNLGHRKVW